MNTTLSPRTRPTPQPPAPATRLDRQLMGMSTSLLAMIEAGEFIDCPNYMPKEMGRLAMALIDASEDAHRLIHSIRGHLPSTSIVVLALASAAILVAGLQSIAFGEVKLGAAECLTATGLFVWASFGGRS